MFDKRRFLAQVILCGMTLKQVAKSIGISDATLHRKMNGVSDFTRGEIQRLCQVLKIDDPASVFFAEKLT